MAHKIALVGIGKIARDQHIPVINSNPDWELAATVSRNASVDGIESFSSMERLLEARPDIDTISLAIPATLEIPSNRQTPIAAALSFTHPEGAEVLADFDWRLEGEPVWEILLQSNSRELRLSFASGSLVEEYRGLYRKMSKLRDTQAIDMDLAPLMHVADAFMSGRRESVAPFEF